MKALNDRYEAHMADGFPCDFVGPGDETVAETLQLRSTADRTNWLTLDRACARAEAAGYGDAPIGLPLRCTSNRSYAVSNTDCRTIMDRMSAWAAASLNNQWRLKALIEAAETRDDLYAIDLNDGWPGPDGSPPVPPAEA